MRNLIYITTLLLLFYITQTSTAQNKKKMNFEKQWKTVEEFEQKSLPQSAAKLTDSILNQAIIEKNKPQIIKAIIHQAKYQLDIDAQNDTLIFSNLNQILQETNDEIEKSVVHSLLAELYLQYYQVNQWNISQRTELKNFVPEDLKVWSRNIFNDKIKEHLNASLSQKKLLEKTKIDSYAEILNLGKDSRRFYPTFYDFLMRRAINIFAQIDTDKDLSQKLAQKQIDPKSLFETAPRFVKLNFNLDPEDDPLQTLRVYQQHLISLQERGLNASVVLTELDKLDYLQRLSSAHKKYALPQLQQMLQQWLNEPISIEIADKIAEIYSDEINEQSAPEAAETVQKQKKLFDFLNQQIDRYPDYERISLLQNRLAQLTQPQFSVNGNKTFLLKSEKNITLKYKNIGSAKAKLYKLESPAEVMMLQRNSKFTPKRTFIREFSISLPQLEPYRLTETSIELDVNEAGIYELNIVAESSTDEIDAGSGFYFSVSDLTVFSRLVAKDQYEFFAVDRATGKPVKDAKINIYKLPANWNNSKLTLEQTIPVNNLGLAFYQKDVPNFDLFFHAVAGNDTGALLTRIPSAYYYTSTAAETPKEQTAIFTDRSLYRPGQVVHFKAIASRTAHNKTTVVTSKPLEFVLRDANHREISKQTLKSNEFGSVAGEFVLPQGLLTGTFSIESANGKSYFKVEEYKRPTFEVAFDKVEQTYKFGEELTLRGKAENFSGIKLQDATVRYNIVRQQMWWRFWGNNSSEQFAEGTVMTDENGTFEIKFTPQKPDSDSFVKQIFSFAVEAVVTDSNGETQTANYSITVGDVSMILEIDIPEKMEKSSEQPIQIEARNLDGNKIDAKGNYRVYRVQKGDTIHQSTLDGQFETGIQAALKQSLFKLPSGEYLIKLTSIDHRGNEVEAEKAFLLYSYSDKKPPIETNDWLLRKNTTFSNHKNGEVILGVSDKNVQVLYELYQSDKLLERKWMVLNAENKLFTIPYKNEYKNGVSLLLTYVKNEKFYSHSISFTPESENKALEVKLDVFRDKVRPGSREEWRIAVKDASGNPVAAEVLASMYDFSLDQIYAAAPWGLRTAVPKTYVQPARYQQDATFATQSLFKNFKNRYENIKSFDFDRLNWFDFSFYYSGRMLMRSATYNTMTGYGAPAPKVMRESMDLAQEESLYEFEDDALNPSSDSSQTTDSQIRRNFNETAFFFPQLRTNENGETLIAFTVPDTNTKWRFRVLAHDKTLNNGQVEAFTVSQKELMVTPNLPRFLRHGDQTSLTAKISNLSENNTTGNVKIEFFDPSTEETIDMVVQNQSQSFSLAKDASSSISWKLDVPDNLDLLGIRILAESESFSDGEQHALAVLPNRMLVTESMRMNLNGNQDREYQFERLLNSNSKTQQNYRYTVEFTSNPVWYALQALPVLGTPDSDNAISWFAAYYVNALAGHIGKTYPKVISAIKAWQSQGGDAQSMLSNLEKNEELKNILLEETPWVLEAKNESEQKAKLALLFDINRQQNITASAIDKLNGLQTSTGGWSWFKGFYPNVSITQYILYGWSQLREMDALTQQDEVGNMQSVAIEYIDAEALERFEQLKKWNKKWKEIKSVSGFDLEYLYVRSFYPNKHLSKESESMINFYTQVIKKNWTQYDLYHRALIAVLMHQKGEKALVEAILKSFREHATINDEMGMFWANNRAQTFMSQSAVTVHTFIMEAFRMGGASAAEMDLMKQWLLKQKQTQLWESTHATIDAVHALLKNGTDWFASKGETKVWLGQHQIVPERKEAATGYFKQSWERSEIESQMGSVKVEHRGEAPAWGAVYLQYFEDIDKIEQTHGSLGVEKQLFVETNEPSGKTLNQITADTPLKVGDKVVVRLVVRADRDFEFVHLKDMRAACFEPAEQLSQTHWMNSVIYYQTHKDASTNFYFDTLPRGTYVFEYPVFVNRSGAYSGGITTIQCMYAPEFTSHTAGMRINVK